MQKRHRRRDRRAELNARPRPPRPSTQRLYDPAAVTTQPRPSDSFILSFSELTEASPSRRRDAVLRALDLSLSALFLAVSLPVTVLIALATVLTSGLPLFYRGERIGRGARIFHMLKFRTLRRGAEERLGPFLGEELMRRTRRETTWLGGWLRATQLDEIPQLLNVLRRDISLVGPPPIRPRFFQRLAWDLPASWQRRGVRPRRPG